MSRPVRLQLLRAKGFNLQVWSREVNDLPAANVARPGPYGNPFPVGRPVDLRQARRWGWALGQRDFVAADAEQAVRRFAACIGLDAASIYDVQKNLRGLNLACWCGLDERWCHADVLLELANEARP